MSTLECFLVTPTHKEKRFFRRYSDFHIMSLDSAVAKELTCPNGSYHNAVNFIGEFDIQYTQDGYIEHPSVTEEMKEDARWPKICECGYEFKPKDTWQLSGESIYQDDKGNLYSLRHLPPGAMYDAVWLPKKGPDGKSLVLKLPDGADWWIDGPSTNGNGWTREGVAPKISTRPSILTKAYHGWLTNGVLTPC